ncbi:MAG: hypothetical protein OXQ86_07150 [Gammaproteobacteria bacterium]|nr:hypothetical protein [Gammaproteobacteria bacterium]MDE0413344.1 hypothetical protein [Gammaproteobacteria bacterium]
MSQPPALAYALLLSPMVVADAPLVITGIPDNGWFRLRKMIADKAAADAFEEFSYDTLPATFEFAEVADSGLQTVTIAMQDAPELIEVQTRLLPPWRAAQSASAIAAGGQGFVSAWFGTQQYEVSNARAKMTVSGDTPLAACGPPAGWVFAQWRRAQVSDRVYWRMPED